MQYSDKLDTLEKRFDELSAQMADPAVISDNEQYRKTAKAHRDMEEVVAKYREYKTAAANLAQAQGMLAETDPEIRAMAEEEVATLTPQLTTLEEELKVLLLPKDPNDEKNVVIEIRAGTGGDEATLFAAEIYRMYMRYAETMRWRVEVTDLSESEVGGIKEVIALISGERCTACSACRKRKRRAGYTRRRSLSRFCPKPTTWKSTSRRRTCASTRSARQDPADSR